MCRSINHQILILRLKSGDLWNDTLTINLNINNPMMSAYSFARQLIEFTSEEEKLIEDWFIRTVKRGEHLMYGKKYGDRTGAKGVPMSAHNHDYERSLELLLRQYDLHISSHTLNALPF